MSTRNRITTFAGLFLLGAIATHAEFRHVEMSVYGMD